MKLYLPIVLILLLNVSCEECGDCGPIQNDPFLKFRFYSYTEKAPVDVFINSINEVNSDNFEELYKDTASVYRFPLAFQKDTTEFHINYTEYSEIIEDTINYSNTIKLSYFRKFVEENNFIKIEADCLNVVSHSFDSIAPASINKSKLSNEITIQVFF